MGTEQIFMRHSAGFTLHEEELKQLLTNMLWAFRRHIWGYLNAVFTANSVWFILSSLAFLEKAQFCLKFKWNTNNIYP